MSTDQTFPHEQTINGIHIQGSQQTFIGSFQNVTIPGRREPGESPEQLCYKVLGFSSPYVDYRESVISAKGKRVEGTCEWILRHKNYHAWLNGDIRLLWISGGPGKGKTMMSIFLTEDLEQKIPTMENTQLVYYFFSFQDENRNTGVTLLQSLIYQIVIKRPQLRTHLLPYINFQQSEPSLEPLWAIFKRLIQDPELGTMLCVIDGLDESDKEATQILLPRIADLLSRTPQSPLSATFRLIVVSRDISGLEDCTRIKLDPDNNESVHGDIEKFISIRVRDLSKIVGSRHECGNEVQTTLLERAEGTFLWVGFAMFELMQKRTWIEVFDALRTLPRGLPAIFSRMLHQIPAEHRRTSSRILQWVTMALHPLKLLDIAIAIGLESSSISISLKNAITDEITLCGSFLKVQESGVTLIHQSVRDYLLDEKQHDNSVFEPFRIKPNEAHFEMAKNCLQCIEQSNLQQRLLRAWVMPGEPPLLRYATQHWLEHAATCSDLAAKLFGPTQSFFTQNSHFRDNWWKLYCRTATGDWDFNDETPPLLHLACDIGIISWVKIMVHENCSTGSEDDKMLSRCFLDQRDMRGKTALHFAASAGKYPLVDLLFRSRAHFSAKNRGKTALHSAAKSRKDSREIIQFLLDQGAEIDAPDDRQETALHTAIMGRHQQFIQILLDRKASLEAVNLEGLTALHMAADRRYTDIVQLLLDKGANLEAVDLHRLTVLYKAAARGDVDTVQLLLNKGADPEAADLNGLTALHIAAGSRYLDIVQLLLNKGANLEAADLYRSTALHIAAERGNIKTVQLLLDKGANTEAVDLQELTALHIAVERGYVDIVELLLDRGADIQAKTFWRKTALHLAIECHLKSTSQSEELGMKRLGVIQLLVDRGVDKNISDHFGETAFDDPRCIKFLGSLDKAVERPHKRSRQE